MGSRRGAGGGDGWLLIPVGGDGPRRVPSGRGLRAQAVGRIAIQCAGCGFCERLDWVRSVAWIRIAAGSNPACPLNRSGPCEIFTHLCCFHSHRWPTPVIRLEGVASDSDGRNAIAAPLPPLSPAPTTRSLFFFSFFFFFSPRVILPSYHLSVFFFLAQRLPSHICGCVREADRHGSSAVCVGKKPFQLERVGGAALRAARFAGGMLWKRLGRQCHPLRRRTRTGQRRYVAWRPPVHGPQCRGVGVDHGREEGQEMALVAG